MRLTVVLSVFNDVIDNVPFLRDHIDGAPFLIEVQSRCSKTRFSESSLERMRKASKADIRVTGGELHACLFSAGTFDSGIYIISRYVLAIQSWCCLLSSL
jgi:hypothetical protein